ncbi:MAG: transglutaminase domain-containing protein [Pirellulales bacterium]|nr:transglutaminase domain-containing protein [Pirellulales bacterium]
MRHLCQIFHACLLIALLLATSAPAQFETEKPVGTKGAKLDQSLTKKYKFGVSITAKSGPCRGVIATIPVPTDWPEQKVQIDAEDITSQVRNVSYRTIAGGVKQMVISIPQLGRGEEAHALVTFEVTRNSQLPPDDTSIFKEAPRGKLSREFLSYLGTSPFIESNSPKIIKLAKEVTKDKEGWEKVEAIYDAARKKVEYKNGELKGALRALVDGTGDCEELTSLFVAMCRGVGIPARCVWVPEHCYAEFYLIDDEENGYWFPCQPAGARAFGGIPEHRPILQKGDNFRDPDRPKERLRYVNVFLKGAKIQGTPKVVETVAETVE